MITDLIPYLVGSNAAAAGSTTIVVTVGSNGGYAVPPNDVITVCGGGGTSVPTGVTDSRGNTYTVIQSNAASPAAWQFQAVATTGLRSTTPDTITVTYSGTGSAKQVVVTACTGIATSSLVDTPANATLAGTSAAPAITSGTLANAGLGELVVATLTSANAGGAPTWGPGWRQIAVAQTGAGSYCSAAVSVPLHPNIANTTGTTAVTASAAIGSSQAWTMCITALKPGTIVAKAPVGATVFHGAYPSTANPSSPPGQGDINAAYKFDQITGRHAGHQDRKLYWTEGLHATDINHPRPAGTYSDAGIHVWMCVKPTRAAGGGVSSELTALKADLALWKDYLASKPASNGQFGVVLWQEPNLSGKSGSFGDGSGTPSGAGSTPYWSTGDPPMTEAKAASNYQDYCQYYTQAIFDAGLPVAYDPVVSAVQPALDWFPGRRWCSAYVTDYYYTADYWAIVVNGVGGGKGKGNTLAETISQATSQNPPLPYGILEIGINDSHKATSIDYSGYTSWIHNIVVAPLLAILAGGGQLAPVIWYEESQGLGDVDPNPPVNSPQLVIDAWKYLYDKLNPGVAGSPTIVTTSPLPDATVGQPYTGVSLQATGGTPGYTWAITSGQLPAGIVLAADGTLSGTPSAAVTRTPTFQVTDSLGATASAVLSLTADAANLQIPVQNFPGGTVSTPYAAPATATGGVAPYTWAVTSGALPAGLTLASSGSITGVPTTAGNSTFTLQVTDSASATASRPFGINILAAGILTVITTSLPGAIAGTGYSAPLGATGGTPAYTWAITSGTLPPGLTLNPLGTISGIPVAATIGSSLYTFTITVTDSLSNTASAAVSITVTVAVPPPLGHGPWHVLWAAPQPDGTVLGEIVQAQSKTVTLRTEVGQSHEVAVNVDGRSLPASSITELQTDLQVLFGGKIIFCGRVVPTSDQLDALAHRTTITALDYREVLRRRFLLGSDTLSWTGVEQATIAWNMIQATQGRAGGNLGIARGTGQTTGQQQTVTFTAGDFIADDIDQLAQATGGFEWDITPYGAADLRLDIWSPARGSDNGIVLAWGDARIASISRVVDPSTFGDSVYITGNTGLTNYQQDAPDIATRPEGRWDTVIGTTLATQSSLNAYGASILAQAQTLIPSYTVTFYPGAWDGPSYLWLGDHVTLQISSGRLAVNDKLRVMELAFALNPDNVEVLTATIGIIPLRLKKLIAKIRGHLRYPGRLQ